MVTFCGGGCLCRRLLHVCPPKSHFCCPPVKPLAKPGRPAHVCATCNKEFKNSYNLRRHQSVHTGVRMKDRAREQAEGAKEGAAGQVVAVMAPSAMAVGAGGRVERTTVPLSLLHLSAPPLLAPPDLLAGAQQPPLGSQDGEGAAMPSIMASVNPHAPPPAAVVMATGATVQVGQGLVEMAVVNPQTFKLVVSYVTPATRCLIHSLGLLSPVAQTPVFF